MKLALPQFGDSIAPRFEAARRFLMVTLEEGMETEREEVACGGPEGFRRVRLLQIHGVTTLICSGIKGSCHGMLIGSGISVIPKVTGRLDEAVTSFVAGRLQEEAAVEEAAEPCTVPHADLVSQARRLFLENGYEVIPGPGPDAFLIDLVAERQCPLCRRPVRVAICCAAHTYRPTEEILEFHYATATGYNAKVYFSPSQSSVACCREYGIEHLDPALIKEPDVTAAGVLPLLKGRIAGHDRIPQTENRE